VEYRAVLVAARVVEVVLTGMGLVVEELEVVWVVEILRKVDMVRETLMDQVLELSVELVKVSEWEVVVAQRAEELAKALVVAAVMGLMVVLGLEAQWEVVLVV